LTLDITNIEFQVIHKILKLFDMEKMLEWKVHIQAIGFEHATNVTYTLNIFSIKMLWKQTLCQNMASMTSPIQL
jgi:hypothetical protein